MTVIHEHLTLERLGHACVRIVTGSGTVIYIDPWSRVVDDDPQDGDVVFVTHDDFDHYDPAAIAAVAKHKATVAVFGPIDTRALDHDVVSLPLEGEVAVAGIGVRTLPAYDDPEGPYVDDDGEPFHAKGDVIGLVLALDGTTVFYPSDTDVLDHHEAVIADVFIPPIGGSFTMDRHEAADLARTIGPALVLPVHYDTFDGIEADADAFKDELDDEDIPVELF